MERKNLYSLLVLVIIFSISITFAPLLASEPTWEDRQLKVKNETHTVEVGKSFIVNKYNEQDGDITLEWLAGHLSREVFFMPNKDFVFFPNGTVTWLNTSYNNSKIKFDYILTNNTPIIQPSILVSTERDRFLTKQCYSDDTCNAILSTVPINYQDDEGNWKEIKSEFIYVNGSTYPWQATENDFKIYMKEDYQDNESIVFEKDGYQLRITEIETFYQNDQGTKQEIFKRNLSAKAELSLASSKPNTRIDYERGMNNLTPHFIVKGSGIKHNIEIENRQSLPKATMLGSKELIYTISFSYSDHLNIVVDGNKWTGRQVRTTEDILFRKNKTASKLKLQQDNHNGELVWMLPKPYLRDSNGTSIPATYTLWQTTTEIEYEKGEFENITTNYLNWSIPYSYLDNKSLVYPLYIDPTVEVNLTKSPFNEDSYVTEDSPSTNYGSSNVIAIAVYFSDRDYHRSYIRWNISHIVDDIEQITSAEYEIENLLNNFLSSDAEVFEIYDKLGWEESVITWNNQPCGTGSLFNGTCNTTYLDKVTITATEDERYNFTITHIANLSLQASGAEKGIIEFVLNTSTVAYGEEPRWFDSSEAGGNNEPQLYITYKQSGVVDVNLSGASFLEDAWVKSNDASSNFGSSIYTGIHRRISTNRAYRTYMRWNLSSIGDDIEDITSAILEVETAASETNPIDGGVYEIYDTLGWTESGITYNNQPCGTSDDALNNTCNITAVDIQTFPTSHGERFNFTITEIVNEVISRGGAKKHILELVINATTEDILSAHELASAENAGDEPQLYLSYTEKSSYNLTIIDPLTNNVREVDGNDNITVNFTFEKNGVNLTSDVTVDNVSIGDITCQILNTTTGSAGTECSPNCPTNVQAESGYIVLDTVTSNTITLNYTYNITKAFVLREFGMWNDDSNQEPDGGTVAVEWAGCTAEMCNQLTASRYDSTQEDMAASYSVLQADNIQAWNFSLTWSSGENSESFAPDPALPANYDSKCFVNIHRATKMDDNTNNNFAEEEIRSNITGTTTVTFERRPETGSASAGISFGEVVCFLDNTTVQRVDHTMSSGEPVTDDISITDVGQLNSSFVIHDHYHADDGVGQNSIINNLTSTTNVELYLNETGAAALPRVTFYAINFTPESNGFTHRTAIDITSSSQNMSTDFSPAITQKNTSLLRCYNVMGAGGGTAHTRDYWANYFIDTDTIGSINYRTRNANQGSTVRCWIVEWPNETSYETGSPGTETTTDQVWYDGMWRVNITTPTGLEGLQDLYVEANYTVDSIVRNDTEVDSIDYGVDLGDQYLIEFQDPTFDNFTNFSMTYFYVNTSSNITTHRLRTQRWLDLNNGSDWSLRGYWSMDDFSFTFTSDNSTYDTPLESTSATPLSEAGVFSQAWNVQSDFLFQDYTEHLNLTENVTVAFWMAYDAAGIPQCLPSHFVGKSYDSTNPTYGIVTDSTFDTTHNFLFSVTNRTGDTNFVQSATALACDDDNWHHWAGTYDNENLRIYFDGELENTTAATGGIITSHNNFSVGANAFGILPCPDCTFDEVRVWDRALTEEEIRMSMSNTTGEINWYFRNFTNMPAGNYSYYGYMSDNDGEWNTTDTWHVIIDLNPLERRGSEQIEIDKVDRKLFEGTRLRNDLLIFSELSARQTQSVRGTSEEINFLEQGIRINLLTREAEEELNLIPEGIKTYIGVKPTSDILQFQDVMQTAKILVRLTDDKVEFIELGDRQIDLERTTGDDLLFVEETKKLFDGTRESYEIIDFNTVDQTSKLLVRIRNDKLELVESNYRYFNGVRITSEKIIFQEDKQDIFNGERISSELITLSDNVGSAKIIVRLSSDKLEIIELGARQSELERESYEKVLFTDSTNRIFSGDREGSNTITFSDNSIVRSVIIRQTGNKIEFVDADLRYYIANKIGNDKLTLIEELENILNTQRLGQDKLIFSGSSIPRLLIMRQVGDKVEFIELDETYFSGSREAYDKLVTTEDQTKTLNAFRAGDDELIFTESPYKLLSIFRQSSEIIELEDGSFVNLLLVRTSGDDLQFLGVNDRTLLLTRQGNDKLTFFDVVNHTLQKITRFRSASEIISFVDTSDTTLIAVRQIGDKVEFIELSERDFEGAREAYDKIVTIGESGRFTTLNRQTDEVVIFDTNTGKIKTAVRLSDDLVYFDQDTIRTLLATRESYEVLTMEDVADKTFEGIRFKNDEMLLIDENNKVLLTRRITNDIIEFVDLTDETIIVTRESNDEFLFSPFSDRTFIAVRQSNDKLIFIDESSRTALRIRTRLADDQLVFEETGQRTFEGTRLTQEELDIIESEGTSLVATRLTSDLFVFSTHGDKIYQAIRLGNDKLVFVETGLKIIRASRITQELLDILDSGNRQVQLQRLANDKLIFDEIAGKNILKTIIGSESLNFYDVFVRTLISRVIESEELIYVSDDIRTLEANREAFDLLVFDETEQSIAQRTRSGNDILNFFEDVGRTLMSVITGNDELQFQDVPTRTLLLVRAENDQLLLIDSANRIHRIIRAQDETIVFLPTNTRTLISEKESFDIVTFIDESDRQLNLQRQTSELLTFNSEVLKNLITTKQVSEQLEFITQGGKTFIAVRQGNDKLIFIQDHVGHRVVLTRIREGHDILNLLPSDKRNIEVNRDTGEIITLIDETQRTFTRTLVRGEELQFTDNTGRQYLGGRLANDIILIEQTPIRILQSGRISNEIIILEDVANRYYEPTKTLSDQLTFIDSTSRLLTLRKQNNDIVIIVEQSDKDLFSTRESDDKLIFLPTNLKVLLTSKGTSELLTFTEESSRQWSGTRTSNDLLVFNENEIRNLLTAKSGNDELVFTDSANKQWIILRQGQDKIIFIQDHAGYRIELTRIREGHDILNLIEAGQRTIEVNRDTDEVIIFTQDRQRTLRKLSLTNDIIEFVDDTNRHFQGGRIGNDVILIEDTLIRILETGKVANEIIILEDVANRIFEGERITSDKIIYIDETGKLLSIIRQEDDYLIFLEQIERDWSGTRESLDIIEFIQSPDRQISLERLVSEILTAPSEGLRRILATREVQESLILKEVGHRTLSLQRVVNDIIKLFTSLTGRGIEEIELVVELVHPTPNNTNTYNVSINYTVSPIHSVDSCKLETDGYNFTLSDCQNTTHVYNITGIHYALIWANTTDSGNWYHSNKVYFSIEIEWDESVIIGLLLLAGIFAFLFRTFKDRSDSDHVPLTYLFLFDCILTLIVAMNIAGLIANLSVASALTDLLNTYYILLIITMIFMIAYFMLGLIIKLLSNMGKRVKLNG